MSGCGLCYSTLNSYIFIQCKNVAEIPIWLKEVNSVHFIFRLHYITDNIKKEKSKPS